jgi:hypothetical protein
MATCFKFLMACIFRKLSTYSNHQKIIRSDCFYLVNLDQMLASVHVHAVHLRVRMEYTMFEPRFLINAS